MSFSQDISNWIEFARISGDQVLRKVALDAYAGILLRSPVRTGRFRASNRISINALDATFEPDRKNLSTAAGASRPATATDLAKAEKVLKRAQFGDSIIISNSLPYAQFLEDGGSGQAPEGIYGATFRELTANLEQLIRRVSQ